MTDLFKGILDVKTNSCHFLLLAESVNSSEGLFLDRGVPKVDESDMDI